MLLYNYKNISYSLNNLLLSLNLVGSTEGQGERSKYKYIHNMGE